MDYEVAFIFIQARIYLRTVFPSFAVIIDQELDK